MYMIYVDESGNPGCSGTSQYFILSGLILSSSDWNDCFARIRDLRRYLKEEYHFPIRAELHAAALVDTRIGGRYERALGGRKTRMCLYEDVMRLMPGIFPNGKTFSVHIDKNAANQSGFKRSNYLSLAWDFLLNRYHSYLRKTWKNSVGIVISDHSATATITSQLRKMRVYNPLPSRYSPRGYYNEPLHTIIEDPVFRDSEASYMIQMADFIAHSLYRKLYVKGSYRRYNLHRYFDYLQPICLKEATARDPDNMGIVHVP